MSEMTLEFISLLLKESQTYYIGETVRCKCLNPLDKGAR